MKGTIDLKRFGLLISGILCSSGVALAQCSAPPNAIVAENCLTGSPSSEWDVQYSDEAGDPSIQGFATDISVNVGQTVSFKIDTNAAAYTIDIYRMGYYNGMGARKVASITPSVTLPQTQPSCLSDSTTELVDCGNWAVSASWSVPSTATSGIYFAHLIRADTGGDSHIVFIVRNDSSHSDILFQTADETWQAYNAYGGNSLYGGLDTFDLPNRAYKVSYNRPFITRGFANESATFVFGAEYPMVRWLEANGYDVTYFTGVDDVRNGGLILNHKIFLSSGHDEYWSGPRRTNVEAARSAGVNLALFSGNDVFWKTRWENSIDGTNTPYRTLVCYKETLAGTSSGGVLDPDDPPTWTGTWRDPRYSPPADGGRPENSLIGGIFGVNGPGTDNNGSQQVQVTQADGQMRFWRNTAVASLPSNGTYFLPQGTLGYEWDVDEDNGFRPAGAFHLSTATYTLTTDLLLDFGATYGAGTATHHMMMYRAPSGALVFGAGTAQWSWALDSNHDNSFNFPNPDADPNAQQATVNLFADMGVQPATLQSGLLPATKSTDTIPPISTITTPSSGSTLNAGSAVTISGAATDSGGGVVAGVEVSVDGGNTWHPATGRGSWSYSWTPSVIGNIVIESRAVDDSGNLETPSGGDSITVIDQNCPCGAYSSSATPTTVDSGDSNSIEVGVKFTVDAAGYVSAVRFYKSTTNTGTHVGNLWSSSGSLLATAKFTNETSSGWQQVNFSTPVLVTPGNTYVASYFAPAGHYSADSWSFYFSGIDDPPVHLLGNAVSADGVYSYSATSTFPTSSFDATNYWVDLVFTPSTLTLSPGSLSFSSQAVATSSAPQAVTLNNIGSTTLSVSGITITGMNAGDFSQTNNCGTSVAPGGVCTINVTFTPTDVGTRTASVAISDNATGSPQTIALTGTATMNQVSGVCPCSIWNTSVTPSLPDSGDGSGVEVGVKFTSDLSGTITGIRFYKSTANTGTHTGNLWTTSGTNLGTVKFTDEGPTGWQQVNFSTPIAITAGTTYIASYYAPVGHYSATGDGLSSSVDNPPMHAVASSASANGVYTYGSSSAFPSSSYNATNYWVDVVFMPYPPVFSPGSLSFTSQAVGTSSAAQTETLTNTGATPLSISSIAISGTNNGDFSQNNNCGASVAAGAYCTINVTFTPSAAGIRSATVTVTDNGFGSPQSISLTGTGLGPAATLSSSTLYFGSQVEATSSAAQIVTLTNTGNATLNFTSIALGGANRGDFNQVNTCGSTLAPAAYCTMTVTFTPTATGTRVATVTMTDNASGSPQSVTLSGLGLAPPPPAGTCPCSIWNVNDSPSVVDSGDGNAAELGVKFTSSENGWITGIMFYKSSANTGTHIGNLWNASGTLLATGTFTNESSFGWQLMSFANPVPVSANTTYVASYYAPSGHYSVSGGGLSNAVNNPPLQALANSVSPNGVYAYGSASSFPQSSYNSTNYWVDVIFTPGSVGLSANTLTFAGQTVGTQSPAQSVTLTNIGTSTLSLSGVTISGANSSDFAQTNNCGTSVAVGGMCSINVTFGPTAILARAATLTISDSSQGSPQTVPLNGTGVPPAGTCPCTIWNELTAPSVLDSGDPNGVELGVKFTSDQSGWITGVLFYKSAANTGTHIGNLWTTSGTLLATGTFSNETASGWQQLNFNTPVQITAGTNYVASYYAPAGHYSATGGGFANSVDNPPLHAVANGTSANGVYSYSSSTTFPQSSWNSTNYWVDVILSPTQ